MDQIEEVSNKKVSQATETRGAPSSGKKIVALVHLKKALTIWIHDHINGFISI